MAKYVITREFGAVYLTDNLLSPPQHQKQLFKVGQIIDARKPTQQEIDTYKVSDATNLISSDNWIIYTNAVQPAPADAPITTNDNKSSTGSTPFVWTPMKKVFAGALAIGAVLGILKLAKVI